MFIVIVFKWLHVHQEINLMVNNIQDTPNSIKLPL